MGFATTSGRPLAGANHPEPQADPEATEIAAAQKMFEDAAANGDPQAIDVAHRRLNAARAAAERARAAGRGRERQAQEHAEREQARGEAAKRAAFLRWAAEWARRAGPTSRSASSSPRPKRTSPRSACGRHRSGDRSEAVDAGLYAGMPDGVQACARAIPDAPKVPTDITRTTGRSDTGHPVVVERIAGEDRYERLAAAIDDSPTAWKGRRDAPRSAAGRRGPGRRLDRPGLAGRAAVGRRRRTHRGPGETIWLLVADAGDRGRRPTPRSSPSAPGSPASWTPRGNGS